MYTREKLKEILTAPLKGLSLTDQEADFYIQSLILGPTTIQELATSTGIARPNIYKIIRSLESHGLAQFSERKKFSRHFVVASPSRLLELYRTSQKERSQAEEKLASFMPDLLTLFQQGELPTSAHIYQGQEQFLKLFFQVIEEEDHESCYFGSAQDFIGLISWQQEKEWIKQRMKKDIEIRALLLPGKDAETLRSKDASELRETRIMSNEESFVSSFQLFANKVIFWQPKAKLAVLIEDQYIAGMMKNIFEKLWKVYA